MNPFDENLLSKSISTSVLILFIVGGFIVKLIFKHKHTLPLITFYESSVKLITITAMIALFRSTCCSDQINLKNIKMFSRISEKNQQMIPKVVIHWLDMLPNFQRFLNFNIKLLIINTIFDLLLNFIKDQQYILKTLRIVINLLFIGTFVIYSFWKSQSMFNIIPIMILAIFMYLIGILIYESIYKKNVKHSEQLITYLISLINFDLLYVQLFCSK